MNSGEKNARIVWRMKSVDATRVMPSRCATSAATVDLPVPVEPPIKHDDRHVERLQVGEPAQAADRALALVVAEHLLREHVADAPPRRCARRVRPGRARSAGRAGRPVGGDAAAISARAISPFEYGRSSSPSGSGSPCRGWLMRAHRRQREQLLVETVADQRRSPRARRACRPRARARRRRRSPRPSSRPGRCRRRVSSSCRSAARSARFAETCTTSASRCETSVAPAVKTATRPSSGSVGAQPELARSPRHGSQHDVGDQPAVGVEVCVGVLAGADDEHPPVDVDRRDRGAGANFCPDPRDVMSSITVTTGPTVERIPSTPVGVLTPPANCAPMPRRPEVDESGLQRDHTGRENVVRPTGREATLAGRGP